VVLGSSINGMYTAVDPEEEQARKYTTTRARTLQKTATSSSPQPRFGDDFTGTVDDGTLEITYDFDGEAGAESQLNFE
jgi:hypothetical protein